jgi:phosphoesterase RecJ-like protein
VGGDMEAVLAEMKSPFIMIDHHQKPDDYAAYTYSDTFLVPLVKCCITSFLS